MRVSFLDLKAINERFSATYETSFSQFLQKGYYILGDQLKQFEENFAAYCSVKYAIGVGNGYDALLLILKAHLELGWLKKGDHVLVPSNTFIATILSIQNAGLTPILVEPNGDTFNIDPDNIRKQISPKVKMIVVTHLYGQLADMNKIKAIAKHHQLHLVSDAAQAHGAMDDLGNRAGAIADASSFSFYPSKNLGALGDGGCITTNNQQLADCLFKIRNYGSEEKYHHDVVGVNSRLDEVQAVFLIEKLKFLDQDNERRREIARMYMQNIKNQWIKLPYWDGSKNHVFHLFVVQCDYRNALEVFLKENGISTLVHYPVAIPQQRAFKNQFIEQDYSFTNQLSDTVLSLPISPVMTDEEVNYVIKTVNQFKVKP